MFYCGASMASDNDSYDDFDDSVFDEEIMSNGNKEEIQDMDIKQVKNNMATWRKIEDFWDNYRLNKQINDDPFDDNFGDYLADGELN